jgi:adenosine deaminase
MSSPHGLTPAFLREIPKTDLHVHLDGSIRLSTLMELAEEQDIELPADTPEGMRQSVFKPSYANLVEYLAGFRYTDAVMSTEVALERVAYEFAVDNYDEGVFYFEVRYAPQLHANLEMGVREVILAVDRGLRRARDEYNAKDGHADAAQQAEAKEGGGGGGGGGGSGGKPRREYGIICCALRMFGPMFSPYYHMFCEAHKHEDEGRVQGLASRALVSAIIALRAEEREAGRELPVVGVDIAGAEDGYQASLHQEAFDLAHEHLLSSTVHAGEAYGPESLKQVREEEAGRRVCCVGTCRVEQCGVEVENER